jgi:hypothetical protein
MIGCNILHPCKATETLMPSSEYAEDGATNNFSTLFAAAWPDTDEKHG